MRIRVEYEQGQWWLVVNTGSLDQTREQYNLEQAEDLRRRLDDAIGALSAGYHYGPVTKEKR